MFKIFSHLLLCFLLFAGKCLAGYEIESIKKRLDDYCKEDQELRKKALHLKSTTSESLTDIFKRLSLDTINEVHIEYLKEVIDHYGWLKISEFGQETCQQAWLLIQHCSDIVFQKDCLEKMQELDHNEIDLKLKAYLYDRIQVNQNLPQRYGTQTDLKGDLLPLEDPNRVNELRNALGLEPLNDYIERVKKIFC